MSHQDRDTTVSWMVRIQYHFRRRKFAKTVITETAWNLHELFNSPSAVEKYPSLGILKRQGKATVNAFKKELMTKVRKIVYDDHPYVAWRRELMSIQAHYTITATMFDDEFKGRRHELYTKFTHRGGMLSDDVVAISGVWYDAEVLFLTLLQSTTFDDLTHGEW